MEVIKIGVAGAHSTGKTSFLLNLRDQIEKLGRQSVLVPDFGDVAVKHGVPNFTNHTFESTAWYIAKGIEFESRLSLENSIILVDRPIPDAVGYLAAALQFTNRYIEERKFQSRA
jgi:GTPase SAR1 family protein